MKKMFTFIFLMLTTCLFSGCFVGDISNDVVRIHIRANSNNDCDQQIKLKIRDEVVSYITPLIALCDNSNDVKKMLTGELSNLENISNCILAREGFCYSSIAKLDNEFFPLRQYEEVVFPADYYDALIIELGSGKGDNWWCVAYPPLCFVGEDVDGDNVKYKSKLIELINNFLGSW